MNLIFLSTSDYFYVYLDIFVMGFHLSGPGKMCRGGGGRGAKGENEGVSQLEQVDDEEMENNILGTELWALAGFSRNVQIGHRFS